MTLQNSFFYRRTASFIAIVLLSLSTQSQAAPRVLAAASTKAAFVAHVETVENGVDHTKATQTSIYRRLLGGDGKFTKLITLNGRVAALGCEADEAVVLLDDNQWMTVWPGNNPLGPAIPNARILSMTGATNGVWAIALQQPLPTMTTVPSTSPATAASPSTQADEQAGLAIFQLAGAAWQRVCSLPEGLDTISADDLSFAISGSTITLGVGGFDGIRIWTREQDRWSPQHTIRAGRLPTEFRILECGVPPLVWFDDGQQGIARNGSEQLLPSDGAPTNAARSAACVAEAVRVFSESDDKSADAKLAEQAYTLDGKPIGKRVNLVIDASTPSSDAESWISTLLTVVVTVLLFTSAWRRPVPTPDVLEKAQAVLAPQGWRLLAGVIDLLPLVIAVTIQASTMNSDHTLSTMPTTQEMLPFYIGVGVYVAHTLAAELITGRSIGKFLVGLRVISSDGNPLTAQAVIVRNVLRLIDVMLIGLPLALILFSPMRQRLGDMAGRTIVIRDAVIEESNEPAEPAA